jgi:hypothetical protein
VPLGTLSLATDTLPAICAVNVTLAPQTVSNDTLTALPAPPGSRIADRGSRARSSRTTRHSAGGPRSSAQPVGPDPNNRTLGRARLSSGELFALAGVTPATRHRHPPPGSQPHTRPRPRLEIRRMTRIRAGIHIHLTGRVECGLMRHPRRPPAGPAAPQAPAFGVRSSRT